MKIKDFELDKTYVSEGSYIFRPNRREGEHFFGNYIYIPSRIFRESLCNKFISTDSSLFVDWRIANLNEEAWLEQCIATGRMVPLDESKLSCELFLI